MLGSEEERNQEADRKADQPDDETLDRETEDKGKQTPVNGVTEAETISIGEAETISLLDLMDEADDLDIRILDSDPKTQSADSNAAADISPDDQATPTGSPVPAELPKEDSPPLPLTAPDLTPVDPPAVSDAEATRVQPRSAFPGQTQLHSPPDQTVQRRKTVDERVIPETNTRPTPEQTALPASESLAEEPTRALPRRPPIRSPQPTPALTPYAAEKEIVISGAKGRWPGCLGRFALVGILLLFITLAIGVAAASFGYIAIAGQLPLPSELRERASTFETAQILDRNGRVLYSLADPATGNRSFAPLSRIDQDLQNATIATEDARFYTNPGFDPIAITRAVYQAALEGEVVSGASTITQQLARALLLDEEERTQRTFSRKVKEIVLAAELFRTYPKEEILELYLNEIYYGSRAYGIEAAAQTYFRKSAEDLNIAEASLLAGLPQAPALWDPFTAPDKALGRQREVLALMVSEGYITAAEAQSAVEETQTFIGNLNPPNVTIRYPHFSVTVLQQLEEAIGAQAIYRGGLRIYTTLDPAVQQLAEDTISRARDDINLAGANNASMVVLEPGTGEILALVGSLDFNDETIDGQVNMALAPRQPGSTIKPLVYLSAMDKGWTPSTLLWDVETEFPDGTNPPYIPKNYDDRFHGPLRLRPALGNSYNIPAVKALEYVGVCQFIFEAGKWGLTSLFDPGCEETGQPRDHGLSLALGGGEVSPVDMAGAFAILANNGRLEPTFAISRIEDRDGNLVFEQPAADPSNIQAVKSEHAYLINSILSDNSARQPEFGINNNLNIEGHQVAAKTGTSGSDRFSVRDGWTIGYTPEVVAAVWVGNTDNQPVGEGQNGYRMASPIWHNFMTQYLSDKEASAFTRPEGIVELEICADSGALPGPSCGQKTSELFDRDHPPDGSDRDLAKPVEIDLWTNLAANDSCPESTFSANFFNLVANGRDEVLIREQVNARRWLEETAAGQNWAAQRGINIPLKLPPTEACNKDTLRPKAAITFPNTMDLLTEVVDISGTALGPNFGGFLLDYGLLLDPQGWAPLEQIANRAIEDGLLGRWDFNGISGGPATIRLTLLGPDNPHTEEVDPVSIETRVPVTILEPTPTSTPTSTPTDTPTPTATPTNTPTPSPTASSTLTPTPTPTSSPTAAPSYTPTQAPSPTSAPTIVPTNSPQPPPDPADTSTPVPPATDTPEPSSSYPALPTPRP